MIIGGHPVKNSKIQNFRFILQYTIYINTK